MRLSKRVMSICILCCIAIGVVLGIFAKNWWVLVVSILGGAAFLKFAKEEEPQGGEAQREQNPAPKEGGGERAAQGGEEAKKP